MKRKLKQREKKADLGGKRRKEYKKKTEKKREK